MISKDMQKGIIEAVQNPTNTIMFGIIGSEIGNSVAIEGNHNKILIAIVSTMFTNETYAELITIAIETYTKMKEDNVNPLDSSDTESAE